MNQPPKDIDQSNFAHMFLREKFTNLLVRIANMTKDYNNRGVYNIRDPNYIDMILEVKRILKTYPEWQNIADSWLPKTLTKQ